MAELLLDYGAHLEATTGSSEYYDNYTPLHLAAMNGKPGVVRLLLKRGSNAFSAGIEVPAISIYSSRHKSQ